MDIDLDYINAELDMAIDALQRAKDSLKGDYSHAAVSASVDLGHVIRDLQRGKNLTTRTVERLKKGTTK